jgi:hypothetical protein
LGVADLMDDFEGETADFTFKIIPLLSNAGLCLWKDNSTNKGLKPLAFHDE